jgi:hypothetical protein
MQQRKKYANIEIEQASMNERKKKKKEEKENKKKARKEE